MGEHPSNEDKPSNEEQSPNDDRAVEEAPGEGASTGSATGSPDRRPDFRQRKTQLISAMLGVSLINGMLTSRLVETVSGQISPLDLVAAAVIFALGFWWLHLDGRETGARRTPLFNIGIVLLAIVFVPLYFLQARPPGRRLIPVLGFLGLVVASSLMAAVGAALVGGGSEVY